MKYILFFLPPLALFATASFITPAEYASQLYKNPRGIGCNKCHGESGEGRLIATYKHKGKKRFFRGPKISRMHYSEFYRALNSRKRAMPRYFLTDREIQALYLHLHQDKNKQEEGEDAQ